jgi:hypothetical protein
MIPSEPRIGEGARCRQLGIDGYLPNPSTAAISSR